MQDIFADGEMSAGAVRFFGKLVKSDRGGGCHAQFSIWAQMMRAGVRSVKRWADELRQGGYIKTEKHGGPIIIFVNPRARAASGFAVPKMALHSERSAKNGTTRSAKNGTSLPYSKNKKPVSFKHPVKTTGQSPQAFVVSDEMFFDTFEKLKAAGLREGKANQLAQVFSQDRVAACIKYAQGIRCENPPGLIVSALESDYPLPAWAVVPGETPPPGEAEDEELPEIEWGSEAVRQATPDERMELLAKYNRVFVVGNGTRVKLDDYLREVDPWEYKKLSATYTPS